MPGGCGELEKTEEVQGTNMRINGGPRRAGPETWECFLKPLCVTPTIKLGLENVSCFHQRGELVTVDRTKHYRQGSRTMHFELMESHERAAYFCW